MSLINDALKRANQNQKKNPPPPGSLSGVPLQPVDIPRKSGGAGKFVPLIAIVLVLAAGLFVWKWLQGSPSDKSAKPAPVQPAAAAPAVAEQTPAPSEAKPEPAPVHKVQINTNLVVREPAPAPATTKPTETTPLVITPAPTPAVSAPVAVTPAPKVTTPEPAPAVATAATPAAPVVMPELKLQGIFYRLKNPSAVINGKTVNVGESISGAKIISIDRYQVVIEFGGERKTLTL